MIGCAFVESKKNVQICPGKKYVYMFWRGAELDRFFNNVFLYTLEHYYSGTGVGFILIASPFPRPIWRTRLRKTLPDESH